MHHNNSAVAVCLQTSFVRKQESTSSSYQLSSMNTQAAASNPGIWLCRSFWLVVAAHCVDERVLRVHRIGKRGAAAAAEKNRNGRQSFNRAGNRAIPLSSWRNQMMF